jgi:KTSC domain
MQRNSVASSNLQSVGYEPQSATLEVEFQDGRVYQYYGVPQNMYDRTMSAPSKGQFLNAYIKNQYPYSRTG